MFEFQIVTKTEADAERFMAEIGAEDVSIEDWSQSRPGQEYKQHVCSFGLTQLSKKRLSRIADSLGVALIYVEEDI